MKLVVKIIYGGQFLYRSLVRSKKRRLCDSPNKDASNQNTIQTPAEKPKAWDVYFPFGEPKKCPNQETVFILLLQARIFVQISAKFG